MINLKPGRELDQFVAEKVMGWKILSHWEPNVPKHLLDENQCEVIPPLFKFYSTDINAAWQIVDYLKDWHFSLKRMSFYEKWHWEAYFKARPTVIGETAPHAICLAALMAIGHQIDS
jgi:hypothetical protein